MIIVSASRGKVRSLLKAWRHGVATMVEVGGSIAGVCGKTPLPEM
jgi:hypothetical protein